MQTIFAILAAFTAILASSAADDGKAEDCNGVCSRVPALTCAERCPTSTAIQAAVLLVTDFCSYLARDDLGNLQGGLVGSHGTLTTTVFAPICEHSTTPLLQGLIPLVSELYCVSVDEGISPIITSVTIDNVGRVTVHADLQVAWISLGEGPYVVMHGRYTFEPVCGTCEYRLTDLILTEDGCP